MKRIQLEIDCLGRVFDEAGSQHMAIREFATHIRDEVGLKHMHVMTFKTTMPPTRILVFTESDPREIFKEKE